MRKSHTFNRTKLATAVSIAVASTISAAVPVYAADDGVMEEVVVTGIRGSLMRSQAIKQDSKSIVEAVSAEDIGKLPDTSIAESLARLPGLAGERSGGRVSGVAVRGFKEDFVGTSLNGREIIGIGDNRGVEYDLYPSEIMTGAVIYKSADAALMTQGIGGTVDMRTVRPLDAKPTLTLNGVYETTGQDSDNPEYGEDGHRYALSFVHHFNDSIGLAVTVAQTESPTNQRKYGVWGYGDNGAGQILPFGLDTQSISKELERDTESAVLQIAPTEDLEVTLDYLNIDFSDRGVIRGFIEPFSAGTVTGTGINSSGTQVGANPVLRTDPENIVGDLQSYGINAKYRFNDTWSAEVDISSSESSKLYERAESYAGLGRNGSLTPAQLGTRQFQMSSNGIFFTGSSGLPFDDPNSIKLTGPQQWGGGMASVASQFASTVLRATDGNPYSYLEAQDGFWNHAEFDEELNTYKVQITGELDYKIINSVTFGVQVSERTKSKVNHGDFATASSFPFGAGNGAVVDAVIPASYQYGLADLSWAGLGQVIAYDGFAPYRDGTYFLTPADYLEPDRLGDTFEIDETVTTIFAKADFETQIGGMEVYGNFGLQYVDTDQESDGYLGIVNANKNTCLVAGSTPWAPVLDSSCQISGGATYSHTLPSLNVNFAVAENQYVRLAASKTISRARLDQMKASGFVKFDQNIDLIERYMVEGQASGVTPWSKSQGNPELEPLEANNFDISWEMYFDDEGYVAATYFYKDLVNWTDTGGQTIDFNNDATNNGVSYFIPGFHDRTVTADGTVINGRTYNAGDLIIPFNNGVAGGTFDNFVDGLEGSLDGIELSGGLPFRMFHESLDGLGLAASATFIDGELDNNKPIVGQSDESYSLTLYYERAGFEFRVAGTKRSDYPTYERGGSNKIAEVTRGGVKIIDAQISYDFAESGVSWLEGLRVSLQGTNLTEEGDTNVDSNGIVTLNRDFGRVLLLNVNYAIY
ncbi:MAG: TonB-dependent receptor [Pseudomonadales bacterium]|nr:TonB-dependent receptor [Pseudomonadales bacterium]